MTPKQAIEKAAAFIKRIAYDKKLHYVAGLLIAGVLTNFIPVLCAVGIAVLVGAAKEVYDRVTKKGTPEFADFLWTSAGALTWLLLYVVLEYVVLAWITRLT